jgi:hypothetical protein
MALSWAKKRQLDYILTILGFLTVVGLIIFLIYKPAPSCFDGKQNQNEQGVDCGGACALACAEATRPLKIYWARPLKVSAGWYDLVAQVENLNANLGNRSVPYALSVYDVDNTLIARRLGATFVNPGERFIIFESRVETGEREAQKVFLEFPTSTPWEKVAPIPKDLYVERRDFVNEPKPVLRLSVDNSSLKTYADIQVTTVLADINNNVFGASRTTIDRLAPNTRQEIYFTWPETFSLAPSTIDSYWRVNAFDLNN